VKSIVDEATEGAPQSDKNPAAVELGHLGGRKGGRSGHPGLWASLVPHPGVDSSVPTGSDRPRGPRRSPPGCRGRRTEELGPGARSTGGPTVSQQVGGLVARLQDAEPRQRDQERDRAHRGPRGVAV
jgi:hypothetical protein